MGAVAGVVVVAAATAVVAKEPKAMPEVGEERAAGPGAGEGEEVGEDPVVVGREEGEEGDRRYPRTACPPRSGWAVGGALGRVGGIGLPET
jgi:hypothetical protein